MKKQRAYQNLSTTEANILKVFDQERAYKKLLHRMVRKYTKSKSSFTSENSLKKLVYCAYKQAMKKWSQPLPNWHQ